MTQERCKYHGPSCKMGDRCKERIAQAAALNAAACPAPVELAEVWCVNDASNAVANIDGVGYCAPCFVPAYAEARKAARA